MDLQRRVIKIVLKLKISKVIHNSEGLHRNLKIQRLVSISLILQLKVWMVPLTLLKLVPKELDIKQSKYRVNRIINCYKILKKLMKEVLKVILLIYRMNLLTMKTWVALMKVMMMMRIISLVKVMADDT